MHFRATNIKSLVKLNFLKISALLETTKLVPYVILNDEAFGIHNHTLRSYSYKYLRANIQKTIYNY